MAHPRGTPQNPFSSSLVKAGSVLPTLRLTPVNSDNTTQFCALADTFLRSGVKLDPENEDFNRFHTQIKEIRQSLESKSSIARSANNSPVLASLGTRQLVTNT